MQAEYKLQRTSTIFCAVHTHSSPQEDHIPGLLTIVIGSNSHAGGDAVANAVESLRDKSVLIIEVFPRVSVV